MSGRREVRWFRAANAGGRFDLAHGVGKVRLTTDELEAELRAADGSLAATIRGTVDSESGRIEGRVGRAGEDDGGHWIYGYLFQRDEESNPEVRLDEEISILLTDGWTTYGIALPGGADPTGRGKE